MPVRRGDSDSGKIRVLYVVHGHMDFSPGGGELAAIYNYDVFRRSEEYDAYLAARADMSIGPHPGTSLLRHEKDPHTYFICTHQDQYDFFYESFLPGSPEAHYNVLSAFRELLLAIRPHIVHFHHYHKLGVDLIGYVHQVLPNARIVMTLHEYMALCAHSGSMITRSTPHKLCSKPHMLNCIQCFPKKTANDFFLRKHHIMKNFEHVHFFVAPSRFLQERYTDWGISPERIIYLDYGRPIWATDPSYNPRSEDRFVVSFFGQIVFHKGLDVFLKAAREYELLRTRAIQTDDTSLPEIRFVVYGTFGKLPQELQTTIDEILHDCRAVVTYNGQYEPDQMPKLMANADAVIVPSVWWENAPLVIQEAFMAKKPVICSNIGGSAERVQDRVSGLHFVVGDHFDLLNKIIELANSPQFYSQLVDGIPDVFSDKEMYEVLDREYRRILSENQSKPFLSARAQ